MYVDPIRSGGCWSCAQLASLLRPQTAGDTGLLSLVSRAAQSHPGSGPWDAQYQAPTLFDHLLAVSQSWYRQGHAKEEKILASVYNRIYLQYPNDRLQALADRITYGLSSNDDKATAIIQWVLRNFPYAEDRDNYGYEELWVPPTFALHKGSGDCEDGAFIVHSLLLHAGIPYERVRTYGGLVEVDQGAATGGHAWTAYRRESDNEWVILDTSYRPTLAAVDDRPLMKDASRYVDNFFYFNALYWVNLEDVDRIHDPGAIYAYKLDAFVKRTAAETTGFLLDVVA